MRLADDPTPADPLRELRAESERSVARLIKTVARLADVHDCAGRHTAANALSPTRHHQPNPSTPEIP